jgi:tetratricopeptide (TPR) repeat protein
MKRLIAGPDNIEEAIDLNNLGNLFFETGKLPLAADYFRKAIAVKRANFPGTHPSLATSLNNLGSACIDLKCYSEAEGALKEALRIRQATLSADHPAIGDTLNNLAVLAERQERYELARNYRMQAMSAPAPKAPGRI